VVVRDASAALRGDYAGAASPVELLIKTGLGGLLFLTPGLLHSRQNAGAFAAEAPPYPDAHAACFLGFF